MTQQQILDTLDRIEVEAGCDLGDLPEYTARQRALRLLTCGDPPRGKDGQFVVDLANGQIEETNE